MRLKLSTYAHDNLLRQVANKGDIPIVSGPPHVDDPLAVLGLKMKGLNVNAPELSCLSPTTPQNIMNGREIQ